MKFDEIKELVNILDKSSLSYFEIKTKEGYIKLDKSLEREVNLIKENSSKENLTEEIKINQNKTNEIKNEVSNEILDKDENFEYIKSPMVGTFYKASSPESNPFVSVGQNVSKGEVLCIVEAMKLMNEINAEFDFEVVSVLASDGEMVEFGQDLFKVRRK